MKKFKKVISIALSLAMMLTMLPSAFAASLAPAQNVSSWFSWDGSAAISADNPNLKPYTYGVRDISVQSVQRDEGDSAAEVAITDGTDGSTSQWEGLLLRLGSTMTPSAFCLSYDINFKSLTANNTGNKASLMEILINPLKTNEISAQHGGNFIMDNGSGSGFSFFNANVETSFDLNKWYTIKEEFDLVAHKEKVTVTSEDGESVVVFAARQLPYNLLNIYDIRFKSTQNCVYHIDNIEVAVCENNVSLDVPQLDTAGATFNAREDFKFNALINGDFTQARVISGGEVVSTFTQGASNNYAITLDKADAKFIGENEAIVEVDFADGTSRKASRKYKTYSKAEKTLFATDMTKIPSNFPAEGSNSNAQAKNLWHSLTGMSCDYDEPRGAKLYMISAFSDGTAEYTGSFFKVAKENGTSAELNLQTDVFETMSTGIVRVTYDVFITGNITRTRVQFGGLKGDGTTAGSKNYDMNNFVNNKWNKLTVDFDLDANTIYYTREAEGETTYTASGVWVSPSSEIDTINKFRLVLITDGSVSNQAYIFKNISASHITDSVNTLSPVSYTMPNKTTTAISSSAKPHSGAEKITLTANGAVVLLGTSGLYNADGKAIEGTTFTANGSNIDVELPSSGVPAGKYTVALGKDTTVAGSNSGGKLCTSVEFVNNSGFVVLNPANAEKVVGKNAIVKIAAPDASKVKFYLDGKLIETKNKNASGIYGFETEAEYGLREAVVVAQNSDKADDVATIKFNLCADDADVSITSADMALNNANKIDVVLSGSVTATEDDVELYVDGIKKSHEGVSVDGNVLSVTLPADLKDNKEIKLVLKNTIDGITEDASVVVYVAGKNGFYADLADFELGTAKFNASLYLVGTSSSDASKVYVAAYEGNELVAVEVFDLTVANGISFKNVSLDITNATNKVKVMVWDALSQTPLMSAAECN